jgi:hypothetical protein
VEIFKQNYKVKIWKYKLIAMQHPTKARRKWNGSTELHNCIFISPWTTNEAGAGRGGVATLLGSSCSWWLRGHTLVQRRPRWQSPWSSRPGRWGCAPVESEAFVRAFSPGSTLEPGLKAFHQRGPKCSLETPP